MPKLTTLRIHETRTRNNRQYVFTPKHHHGSTKRKAASWLPSLTWDEEFGVFDEADFRDYSNEDGKLYGMLKTSTTQCRIIGTKHEQIAVFDPPPQGPWHGYPVYPVAGDGDKRCPSRQVLDKMIKAKLITDGEADRIEAGHHI